MKFSGPLATTSNRDFLALAVLGVSEMSKLMNIDNVIGQFLSSQKMTTMTANQANGLELRVGVGNQPRP